MTRATRVLIADDSPLFRELLSRVVALDPTFEIAATAANGEEAARFAKQLRPDVITMDLNMPDADGFAGIARIMAESPTPILVLSADRGEAATFRALSLGALDLLEKPSPGADITRFGEQLRSRLKLLAGVRVIRHLRGAKAKREEPTAGRAELVVIGSSLGGPRALATLLHALPPDFPAPVAIVQHIADGFTEGLANWLNQETPLHVKEAVEGDRLRAGHALIAPSGRHLLIGDGVVHLSDEPPIESFRPSVTPLFLSAAKSYGNRACGVILTGMGRDGAEGMKVLHETGAHTIAQDEATSAVFGMPRAAIEAGAIERVLPLEEIARALLEVVQ